MDLTYREKSLWLMGIALLVVFGLYFSWVLPAAESNVVPRQIGLFIVAIVLLVVLQVAGHAVMAAIDRRVEPDERDRFISLISERNGSVVLAIGVSVSLFLAVSTDGNFLFTHVLLAFWVLSTLASIATSLWLYRRG
jgi:hypothetical protein